jgi:hypothetical protein
MIDEGTLRERFPEIPWDQPQKVYVGGGEHHYFVCRYCVAGYGVKASDLLDHRVPFAFETREHALDHIEREHHD